MAGKAKFDQEAALLQKMNCPYCREPMEKGYITNGRGLMTWTPEGCKVPFLFPIIQGKSVMIGDDRKGPLLGSEVIAFLCRRCEKVIIDLKIP